MVCYIILLAAHIVDGNCNLWLIKASLITGSDTLFHHYKSQDPNLCRAKSKENQWRIMVIEEFLYTSSPYQAISTIN